MARHEAQAHDPLMLLLVVVACFAIITITVVTNAYASKVTLRSVFGRGRRNHTFHSLPERSRANSPSIELISKEDSDATDSEDSGDMEFKVVNTMK